MLRRARGPSIGSRPGNRAPNDYLAKPSCPELYGAIEAVLRPARGHQSGRHTLGHAKVISSHPLLDLSARSPGAGRRGGVITTASSACWPLLSSTRTAAVT